MVLPRLSNLSLMGIAGIGGVVVGISGLVMNNKMQAEFKEKPQIKSSLRVLKSHQGAQFILGKPIKDFKIDLSDDNARRIKEDEVFYKIPVKGPEGNGFYHLHTLVKDGVWSVLKSELEVRESSNLEEEKYRDKRLVIYDKEKHGELQNYAENLS